MPIKSNRNHLGHRQCAVINDIIKNGLTEYEALEKNKVSPCRYRQWLKNRYFAEQLNARINALTNQREFVVVRALPKAAERLAQLINAEREETARKACLDIISLQKADADKQAAEKAERDERESHLPKISDAKAAKIWAIMAEPDESENQIVGATGGRPLDQQPEVGADPCVCPPIIASAQAPASDWPPPQESTMSYGEWIEKYGLPQPAAGSERLYDQCQKDDGRPSEADETADVLKGAAVCGIKPSLLAEAFPSGMPPDYLRRLCQVAKSPGSNPVRERGLKTDAEAQASVERRKRLMRTC